MSKRSTLKCFFCLLLGLTSPALAGNILFWMDFGSYSHLIVWKPLALELARRGHRISFVGPVLDKDLANNDNISYAHPDVAFETLINSTSVFEGKVFLDSLAAGRMAVEAQNVTFHLPLVQELIREKKKFDVAILTPIANDIGLYLAKEVFQAPIIYFFSCLKWPMMDTALGNPTNPSYIPIEYLNFGQQMSFFQRLANFFASLAFPLVEKVTRLNQIEAAAQELLKMDDKPDLTSISREDIAFGLFNSHPIMDGVKPVGPNTADVGGIHLRDAKKIEDESLRRWLDEAKDGFIYVAFGSILSGSAMPDEVRQKLVRAFGSLEKSGVKVLWKWETEDMGKDLPGNILLKKWLPQQDVLAHPNCKLFVTHGGLMSTYESLYHGVPMVVMPGFADQFSNAARAERQGYGKTVHWGHLQVDELRSAITDMLQTPSYKDAVNSVSFILRDHLTHPLDRAVYHVEYVMRHEGAPFLRSPVKDLFWFQSLLLDVAAFCLIIIVLIAYVVRTIFRCLYRLMCGKKVKYD